MMVETMLESSQDFGMSNGALPQWKRELLQRRAARSRPTPPPAHAPPPPPPLPAHAPPDEDEELRYGPGIVKRLKSRYLSLALRDAPRRRPSVLRRAASLEHLLDERPPPAPRPPPARAPRPASVAAPPAFLPQPRRDIVKRARSVDALSGLDSREEPRIASPSPPPPRSPSPGPRAPPTAGPPRPPAPSPPPPPRAPPTPPPEPAPRPTPARGARPPRRPTPLLRDTERPPPDAVRAALRKFESAPARRTAPAARVSAVLRGLEGPAHTSTPEPRDRAPAAPRSPTPPLEPTAAVSFDESDGDGAARPVSRAALEGIARAGSSVRFLFPARGGGSHLPPPAAANPVLLGRARRVGVIRPMPMRSPDPPEPPPLEIDPKLASPPATPRPTSPLPAEPELGPAIRLERRDPPPAALVEPIPRRPLEERPPPPQPEPPRENETEPGDPRPKDEKALANGHPEPRPPAGSAPSRLGTADVERAWNGSGDRRSAAEPKERESAAASEERRSPWEGARRARAPPPATSVVFDFSGRKEVPDYIENDGIVLRGGRRARFKAGESGVVALRPGAGEASDDEAEGEGEGELDGAPPSPCAVRFVNDNVLINGRSCMAARPNRDRQARLKLQFDDSLTRTFEYPSETSLSEDAPPAAPAAPALDASEHMSLSSLLARRAAAAAFPLGLAPHAPHPPHPPQRARAESTTKSP